MKLVKMAERKVRRRAVRQLTQPEKRCITAWWINQRKIGID